MSSAAVQHSATTAHAQQQFVSSPSRERYPNNFAPAAAAVAASTAAATPSSLHGSGVGNISYNNSPSNNASPASYGAAAAQPPSTPSTRRPVTAGTGSATASHAQSPSAQMSASTYASYYPDSTIVSSPPAAAANAAATSLPIRSSSQHESSRPSTAQRPQTQGQPQQQQYNQQSPAHSSYAANSYDRPESSSRAADTTRTADRTRHVPATSRSTTAMGQPPMGTDLPREHSAVINRIVVDDPQADVVREQMRQAEARPHAPGSNTIAAGLDLSPANPSIPGSSPSSQRQQHQSAADPAPVQRSRQEHLRQPSNHPRKESKFGDYILGQTLGEGEFGKVKMGWKKDSTVQVAIKLIRKESLAGQSGRLPKIYREIAILRELQHPNIVRLHEFVETERHMGIILEYASGGELFDYILNNRYLKDPAARRLFAQLVSGVGYLHKKGIVHRDLKLENLLLDRNKHIIITDFGFANTFDPNDELGDEIERRIGEKDFIRREGLDKVIPWRDGREGGHRRGDLMQTSCGSPCYAAPELVVSDGLYTGRKVDVWSCGVILYAMLAGYLPFDDDPANPEGDNINLLYKYIVSTPLTFPEYVTPHARDLLRRILVPEPRKRADLFEVARHSWLSEYTHVVGFIGSSVKTERDIVATAMSTSGEKPQLERSASTREPTSRSPVGDRASVPTPRHAPSASVGGDEASDLRRKEQDAKRNTVQLEYIPPINATVRGETSPDDSAAPIMPYTIVQPGSSRSRARSDNNGPVEVHPTSAPVRKPVPNTQSSSPNPRPGRDAQRATTDTPAVFGSQQQPQQSTSSISRPTTGSGLGARLPSRGNSYSQPAMAQPTTTNAQGSFAQPKSSSGYMMTGSSPMNPDQPLQASSSRPMSQQARMSGQAMQPPQTPYQGGKPNGHRRSNTLGSIADKMIHRSSSSRRNVNSQDGSTTPGSAAGVASGDKRDRRYPPVSLKNTAMGSAAGNAGSSQDVSNTPRTSTDSRRPSFGFSRKASRERDSSVQGRRSSRRFSFLSSLGFNSFSSSSSNAKKNEAGYEPSNDGYQSQYPPQSSAGRPGSQAGLVFSGRNSANIRSDSMGSNAQNYYSDPQQSQSPYQQQQTQGSMQQQQRRSNVPQSPIRYDKPLPSAPPGQHASLPPHIQRKQFRDDGYGANLIDQQRNPSSSLSGNEPVERYYTPSQDPTSMPARTAAPGTSGADRYDDEDDEDDNGRFTGQQSQQQRRGLYDQDDENYSQSQTNLRPQQRKFADAYDHGHSGSSSATRRVMDFFRRRGKDRGEGA